MKQIVKKQELGNWHSKKEICELVGCDEKTLRNFTKSSLAIDCQTEIRTLAHNKKLYSEEFLKQFQMWLMRNQTNQGRSSQLVKETTTTAVGNDIALKEIINSGNVEAMQCLMEHYVNETRAVGEAKRLEQINNQLQIENKQLVDENDYLKKANEFNTTQLGYYRKKYHSYYDDYEIY